MLKCPRDVKKTDFDDLLKETRGMILLRSKRYGWIRNFVFEVVKPRKGLPQGQYIEFSLATKLTKVVF